jgi:hypothetical protein
MIGVHDIATDVYCEDVILGDPLWRILLVSENAETTQR